MRRFTELYLALDRSTKTTAKLAALKAYFASVDPADGAWAVAVFTQKGLIRAVNSKLLRAWAAEAADLPAWLVDRSYSAVGDLSETLALIVPNRTEQPTAESLHDVVEHRIAPLAHLDDTGKKRLILDTWASFDRDERFMFHKLISGALRVGVSRKLVVRALAEVADIAPAVMDHRLTGGWRPSADAFTQLLAADDAAHTPHRPYPFCLAHQLDADPATLGDVNDWQVEWKWDGIRAQLIRRGDTIVLWSRGDELITGGFPEIEAAARQLPADCVLDGEVLAWEAERPLPFGVLQRRINRKNVELSLFPDVPVTFLAYDLLERAGEDLRDRPLRERRVLLEQAFEPGEHLRRAGPLSPADWNDVTQFVADARTHGAEGVMLKRRDSHYAAGRLRGGWWKWKTDPYTIDAVLVQGEHGSGRRAGLYTSYTFAVWDGDQLVPVTKAYSGLSNDEIEQVDRFIRAHTVSKHGPVRVVEPKLVFEIAFEGLQQSTRHKSGVAFRFPRMSRWRQDKPADEADTLDSVLALLKAHGGAHA